MGKNSTYEEGKTCYVLGYGHIIWAYSKEEAELILAKRQLESMLKNMKELDKKILKKYGKVK